jgi:hypothetical protein
MKYYYRIEHIELFNKKCFIESNHQNDLLAVREDHLINFKEFFHLEKHEKQSYDRIKKWVEDNYPEYLI